MAVDMERFFKDFMTYKTRVPVCGAILVNEAGDEVCHSIAYGFSFVGSQPRLQNLLCN
jgi:hypothetical protein